MSTRHTPGLLYKEGRPSGAALDKNDRRGDHRNGGWGTSTSAMTVADDENLPPKAIARNTGWIDLRHGLRARELGGVYYIAQEDKLRAKVIIHVWKP